MQHGNRTGEIRPIDSAAQPRVEPDRAAGLGSVDGYYSSKLLEQCLYIEDIDFPISIYIKIFLIAIRESLKIAEVGLDIENIERSVSIHILIDSVSVEISGNPVIFPEARRIHIDVKTVTVFFLSFNNVVNL